MTPRPKIRSVLYFETFEGFKKARIEIPFPQKEILDSLLIHAEVSMRNLGIYLEDQLAT